MVRISDARMSGTAFGTVVLHVAPEAAVGGPLALVRDGDRSRSTSRRAGFSFMSTTASSKRRQGGVDQAAAASCAAATSRSMSSTSCRPIAGPTSIFSSAAAAAMSRAKATEASAVGARKGWRPDEASRPHGPPCRARGLDGENRAPISLRNPRLDPAIDRSARDRIQRVGSFGLHRTVSAPFSYAIPFG